MIFSRALHKACVTAVLYCMSLHAQAQTDMDAIMLKKNIFCVGAMYTNDSWKEYWEGTFKRDNENIGTITTRMVGVMGNYGITDKLNALFSIPYVTTKASKGTLKGLHGIQDLSLMLKYLAFEKKLSTADKLSIYAIGRVSFPVTNYVADYLPLSIGMRSKTAGVRALVDFQHNKWFASGSAAYTYRSNIDIDRNSYYTTEMHYSNEVEMYDMAGLNVRAGYRSRYWIAEAVLDKVNTLGGFDIRKNDMPFPSNKMNATRAGANFKHTLKKVPGLEITGGAMHVLSGRNVGQSTTIYGGIFYLMNLSSKNKPRSSQQQ